MSPFSTRHRHVTLPSQHRYLEDTGRLDNFRRAAGMLDAPFARICQVVAYTTSMSPLSNADISINGRAMKGVGM